ncbi:MAG: phenylalanine--tRNA ligase subunit beta [Candidatus Cloacimonetes bacterium]|nr:phenylalanine--tRNA ligase subunit beta [Candidatus Cloacimonadota bacterium]
MKISYKWLRDYIDIDLDAKTLEEELTFSGIEVEAVEELGAILNQILVAEVKERQQHPNSDHLWICQVDNGNEVIQVICGADNCEAGKKVALAPVGTQMGEFVINKAKLRGEHSFGMLCSERELGISDNHDGIINLAGDCVNGEKLSRYYDLSDIVFEVEITPNRPDLLGITGIARDLSSLLHREFRLPNPELPAGTKPIRAELQLDNQAIDLCPRYTARMIKGVTIAESPDWLKRRITAIGLRPINNVVDVTNFVMFELGHPLHAFDYHLVEDHQIIIRRAGLGEKFVALNDEEYILADTDLVIADSKKAIALAGVIGAANSQIQSSTQDIIIEAANFKYSAVRRTSKRLAIFTDSAYRFERDLSDMQAELAGRRCCELILATAGGELLEGLLDSYPEPEEPVIVTIRPSRIKKVLSINISQETITNYLESLGLKQLSNGEDSLQFEVPHYRKDLSREIDLIEEIIRLYGYNNVETYFKPQKVMNYEIFRNKRNLTDSLVKLGFYEVVNWSFAGVEDLDKLRIVERDRRREVVSLKNPLGSSFAIMRPLLLPDILRNTAYNLNHNQKDFRFFELNKVFLQGAGKQAEEKYHLSGLITGLRDAIHWREEAVKTDFYDVKGVVEELLSLTGLSGIEEKYSKETWYQPGVGLDFYNQGKLVASAGKLDPKVASSFEIEVPCFVFDLYLDTIYNEKRKIVPDFREIVKFPPVLRDLSFLIDQRFDLAEIAADIRQSNPELISKIILFDEYKGKNVPSGKRSLTFSLTFSSINKTLNDKLISKEMDRIVRSLEKKYEIKMR